MQAIDHDLIDKARNGDLHYVNGYFDGFIRALYLFAHWKDGEMLVGSCGKTYKDARAEFVAEFDALVGVRFGEKA